MKIENVINKNQVLSYIESRRIDDGGYCFVGVAPSGAVDTHFAVKIYKLFGLTPPESQRIIGFFEKLETSHELTHLKGRYLYVSTLKALDYPGDLSFVAGSILTYKNDRGGFGIGEDVYIEIYSELESTYFAVSALKEINESIDTNALKDYVLSFRNPDGGYGSNGFSTLPTTFYALKLLEMIGELDEARATLGFLHERSDLAKRSSTFMEDIYWLTESLAVLKEKACNPNLIISFIKKCQRGDNFGFTRSESGGIADFEYTYYTVRILQLL